MNRTITIELPEEMTDAFAEAVREEGVSAKNIVLTAVRNYLLIRRFRRLRERLTAETPDKISDQDVFNRVS
jgi:hypothetical protein